MVDFHWGFDRISKADQLAGSLREFAEKPEVVVLRVTLGNRAARDIVAGARSSLDRNPNTYGATVSSFADPNFRRPNYLAW
jgi:ABC-type sugar transport system substrate-binding protein